MVTIRSGKRSLRATAVAATGSGGDTIAPSTAAAVHDSPARCATTAATPAVAMVSPTASSRTGPAASRNCPAVIRCVAAKSNGGSTTGSTRSASTVNSGSPGTSASTRP
jgi:hypothetical protein